MNENCTLIEKDGKLTGACDTATGKFDLTGRVEGTNVSWSHQFTWRGDDLTVSFFGKVEGDAMTGSVNIEPLGSGGLFSATRKSEK